MSNPATLRMPMPLFINDSPGVLSEFEAQEWQYLPGISYPIVHAEGRVRTVTKAELVRPDNSSTAKKVYRAWVEEEAVDGIVDTHQVVLKIVSQPAKADVTSTKDRVASLKKEADIYINHFAEIQGKYVPHMYGFYQATTLLGKVAILVLEDCGVSPRIYLPSQPYAFKLAVLKALYEVHKTGVDHGYFEEGNFVVQLRESNTFDVRIIDFKRAYLHQCEFKEENICERDSRSRDGGCEEMHETCMYANVWLPRRSVHGNLILIKDLPETLNTQELMKWKAEWMPEHASLSDTIEIVERLRHDFTTMDGWQRMCEESLRV